MHTSIYYFSGTGNSLVVAKEISESLKADLVPIPNMINNEKDFKIESDRIGIVFPSYLAALSGFPLVVGQFVKSINNISALEMFAVCTCGGYECVNALPSLSKLKKVVRSCGGRLSAEFSVRLPMNNLDYDHIPVPIIKDQDKIIIESKRKIKDIGDRIFSYKGTRYKYVKKLFNFLMQPLYMLMRPSIVKSLREMAEMPSDTELSYSQLIPLTDRSIAVNENCNSCGTCEKICPVNNIRIVNGRPAFQHACEMCFGCDEWCPSKAIHHWGRQNGVKYHHPEVKISDFIEHKNPDSIRKIEVRAEEKGHLLTDKQQGEAANI
ncbi:MAG: EFR1 family ferrodoxin [Fibrobacterota bacterium]